MSNVYYKFETSTVNPCTMSKAVYEEASKTWLCTECASFKPCVVRAVDATIQETKPGAGPLNVIMGFNLGIAKTKFLDIFTNQELHDHLYIGNVFLENGDKLDDYVSFHGKHEIIVRGSKHVDWITCSQCGREYYFAVGNEYLHPKPPENVGIFYSGQGALVLKEEIAQRIDLNRWCKLKCTKLPVLNQPRDGLAQLNSYFRR